MTKHCSTCKYQDAPCAPPQMDYAPPGVRDYSCWRDREPKDDWVTGYREGRNEYIKELEAVEKLKNRLQKENEELRNERTTKNHYFCDCCKYKAGKTCLLSNNHCIRRATDYFTDSREGRNG